MSVSSKPKLTYAGLVSAGIWKLPSGNRCHANFVHDQALGITHLFFIWDIPPPMELEDAGYYFNVVMPGIAKLLTSRTSDIAVSAVA